MVDFHDLPALTVKLVYNLDSDERTVPEIKK